jgi:hypothetical protein
MTDHGQQDEDLRAYSETNRIMRHSANDDTGRLADRVYDPELRAYVHRKPTKTPQFCKGFPRCLELTTNPDGYCDGCHPPRHASGRRVRIKKPARPRLTGPET